MNEKLKNPPIKETVIGIGINNYFSGDLKDTSLYDEIVKIYPKTSPNYNTGITIIDGKIQKTDNDICGYCFQSEDNRESVFIDNNRIAFSDRSKYESFEVFFNKFKKVSEIIGHKKPIEKCSQIALKYVNQIFLEQNELLDANSPKIKFLPNFRTNKDGKLFAELAQFAGNYVLQSASNTQVKSFVNTSLQFIGNPPRLQVLFIIDTVIDISNADKDALSNLENYMSQLREFKNMIFFGNVEKDIKEFSK
ncbi:MAG: TIGR04255 family protein [Endomicrobium sp.]|jgi:uncharacterized protein (TIGR04255 family)|nr:TIGR04255 family protein [Endomicrobium sp.]